MLHNEGILDMRAPVANERGPEQVAKGGICSEHKM